MEWLKRDPIKSRVDTSWRGGGGRRRAGVVPSVSFPATFDRDPPPFFHADPRILRWPRIMAAYPQDFSHRYLGIPPDSFKMLCQFPDYKWRYHAVGDYEGTFLYAQISSTSSSFVEGPTASVSGFLRDSSRIPWRCSKAYWRLPGSCWVQFIFVLLILIRWR